MPVLLSVHGVPEGKKYSKFPTKLIKLNENSIYFIRFVDKEKEKYINHLIHYIVRQYCFVILMKL